MTDPSGMLQSLGEPASNLLGCRYPIVLAGMGGVARSELVSAVTAAGGFGFLGMVREPPELIRTEVEAVRQTGLTQFGVNLIPAATPPELLERQIAAIIELRVPAVCLFWDIDLTVVRRLRDAGIVVVYQVGSTPEGRDAVAAGANLLIAQGVEAGGHVRGTTPLRELLPAVAAAVDVPVLAAGGIVDGGDLVVAMALGAAGVVLGTAMIATTESFAHDFHKERLLAAATEEAVLTEAFHINWPDGARVRVLQNAVTRGDRGDAWTTDRTVIGWEAGRPLYLFSTDSPLRSMSGDFALMALYAGSGVGRVRKMMTAGRRLERIVEEADGLLRLPAGQSAVEASSPVCYAGINPEYDGYLPHAALLQRLEGLRRLGFAGLELTDTSHAASVEYARWVLALRALIEELGGSPLPLVAAPGHPGANAGSTMIAEAQALLSLVFEDRVRGVLTALLGNASANLSRAPVGG